MIARLTGQILHKSPTELTIDVNGVGYQVFIPLSTSEAIPDSPETATILTHTHVREDALQLFGFATETERELFRMLISVSGIGPKLALSVLSGMPPSDLQAALLSGDTDALTSISGIGRKTAERLVLELKSKVAKAGLLSETPSAAPTSQQLKQRSEALVALMSLGYTRSSAEKALRLVLNDSAGKPLTTEELIRRSLHHASRT
jgi:holliday junction DNA helicase RuvA